MPRVLSVTAESYPIAGAFTISRGSKTSADVLVCTIFQDEFSGRGECVPYRRYGESLESVSAQIEAAASLIANGADRQDLLTAMPAGAARNAVDCALWDLEAKLSGISVERDLCPNGASALETAFTLSLDTPQKMGAQARANADRPLLKIKLGGDGDEERMAAITENAPKARIILDANEGWNSKNINQNIESAAKYGISLIEQPVPAGEDELLRDVERVVPLCADESLHGIYDLERFVGLYDAVNIKLDKTGGLTAALAVRDRARELGFQIMIGCMVGTSLAMAPAVLLAQGAAFVDLDGPLLLARDREPALAYKGSMVSPPAPGLWG